MANKRFVYPPTMSCKVCSLMIHFEIDIENQRCQNCQSSLSMQGRVVKSINIHIRSFTDWEFAWETIVIRSIGNLRVTRYSKGRVDITMPRKARYEPTINCVVSREVTSNELAISKSSFARNLSIGLLVGTCRALHRWVFGKDASLIWRVFENNTLDKNRMHP